MKIKIQNQEFELTDEEAESLYQELEAWMQVNMIHGETMDTFRNLQPFKACDIQSAHVPKGPPGINFTCQ